MSSNLQYQPEPDHHHHQRQPVVHGQYQVSHIHSGHGPPPLRHCLTESEIYNNNRHSRQSHLEESMQRRQSDVGHQFSSNNDDTRSVISEYRHPSSLFRSSDASSLFRPPSSASISRHQPPDLGRHAAGMTRTRSRVRSPLTHVSSDYLYFRTPTSSPPSSA